MDDEEDRRDRFRRERSRSPRRDGGTGESRDAFGRERRPGGQPGGMPPPANAPPYGADFRPPPMDARQHDMQNRDRRFSGGRGGGGGGGAPPGNQYDRREDRFRRRDDDRDRDDNFDNKRSRRNDGRAGPAGGGNGQEPPQLKTFKEFLLSQARDDITAQEAERLYEGYKGNFGNEIARYIEDQTAEYFWRIKNEKWMKALYHPAHLTIQANALSRATQARAHRFLSDTAEAGIAAKDGLSCARPEIVDPPRASAAAPANDAPAAAVADGAAMQGEEAGAGDSAAPVANDADAAASPSAGGAMQVSGSEALPPPGISRGNLGGVHRALFTPTSPSGCRKELAVPVRGTGNPETEEMVLRSAYIVQLRFEEHGALSQAEEIIRLLSANSGTTVESVVLSMPTLQHQVLVRSGWVTFATAQQANAAVEQFRLPSGYKSGPVVDRNKGAAAGGAAQLSHGVALYLCHTASTTMYRRKHIRVPMACMASLTSQDRMCADVDRASRLCEALDSSRGAGGGQGGPAGDDMSASAAGGHTSIPVPATVTEQLRVWRQQRDVSGPAASDGTPQDETDTAAKPASEENANVAEEIELYLDTLLAYLRIVHCYDYYGAVMYDNPRDLMFAGGVTYRFTAAAVAKANEESAASAVAVVASSPAAPAPAAPAAEEGEDGEEEEGAAAMPPAVTVPALQGSNAGSSSRKSGGSHDHAAHWLRKLDSNLDRDITSAITGPVASAALGGDVCAQGYAGLDAVMSYLSLSKDETLPAPDRAVSKPELKRLLCEIVGAGAGISEDQFSEVMTSTVFSVDDAERQTVHVAISEDGATRQVGISKTGPWYRVSKESGDLPTAAKTEFTVSGVADGKVQIVDTTWTFSNPCVVSTDAEGKILMSDFMALAKSPSSGATGDAALAQLERSWSTLHGTATRMLDGDGSVQYFLSAQYDSDFAALVEPLVGALIKPLIESKESNTKFACPWCTKMFKGVEFVSKHMRNKHPERIQDFSDKLEKTTFEDEYKKTFLRDPLKVIPPRCVGLAVHVKDNGNHNNGNNNNNNNGNNQRRESGGARDAGRGGGRRGDSGNDFGGRGGGRNSRGRGRNGRGGGRPSNSAPIYDPRASMDGSALQRYDDLDSPSVGGGGGRSARYTDWDGMEPGGKGAKGGKGNANKSSSGGAAAAAAPKSGGIDYGF